MTFVEPMIMADFLRRRRSFTPAVPRPQALGRGTRYPTTFTAVYYAHVHGD